MSNKIKRRNITFLYINISENINTVNWSPSGYLYYYELIPEFLFTIGMFQNLDTYNVPIYGINVGILYGYVQANYVDDVIKI